MAFGSLLLVLYSRMFWRVARATWIDADQAGYASGSPFTMAAIAAGTEVTVPWNEITRIVRLRTSACPQVDSFEKPNL
jgi:4-hydroxybenzoate polyprenyltransferase